jgi:hypothetical protein
MTGFVLGIDGELQTLVNINLGQKEHRGQIAHEHTA